MTFRKKKHGAHPFVLKLEGSTLSRNSVRQMAMCFPFEREGDLQMAKMCFVQLKWWALPVLKVTIFLHTLMEWSHQLKKEIFGVSET